MRITERASRGGHWPPIFFGNLRKKAVQRLIGLLLVDGAVHVELHPVRGVHELEAQVRRHQLGGKILAPADQLLLGDGFGINAFFQLRQLDLNGQVKPQVVPDVNVPVGNEIKNGRAVHAVLNVGVAQIQKVRQLMILAKPLAGGGHNHHPPVRIGHEDVPHLPVLARVRHGAAAEFYYFHLVFPL